MPAVLPTLVLLSAGLMLMRRVALVVLAVLEHVRQRRRDAAVAGVSERPAVTVVIPAYNEEKVIAATIRSVLGSDWPDLHVVMVDDGSSDDTVRIARETAPGRVTVLVQPRNAGKARALDAGIAAAAGEIVVTVDADTHVEPDCIRLLVSTMVHTRADAVCGNVKVGNRHGLVGRWQSLEYVAGLNVDRRAQGLLRIISTVPGAAGAWRVRAVRELGGFSSDTLAEDTDLSIAFLRANRRLEFADRALSRTEAPATWGALFRQRVRWLYGNLQCTGKYSRAWWTPAPWRVRLLAIPNLWITHLAVHLLFPLWLAGAAACVAGLSAPWPATSLAMAAGFAFGFDLLATLAVHLMDRDDPHAVVHVPLYRLGYSFFQWAVFAVVVLRMARRVPMGWNKLDRTGVLGERPAAVGLDVTADRSI